MVTNIKKKKKNKTILQAFVFPTVLLILLPLFTCIIIYESTISQIRNEAFDYHQRIIKDIESLLDQSDEPDSISRFLDSVGLYAAANEGAASIIILSDDFEITLPRDEDYKEARASISAEFAGAIKNKKFPDDGLFVSSSGDYYHVTYKEFKNISEDVRHLICYTPVTLLKKLRSITIFIFFVTFVISIIVLGVMRHSANKISKMTQYLCSETERIGAGDFTPVKEETPINELDELRQAINLMSCHLENTRESEKTYISYTTHNLRNRLMKITGYAQELEYNLSASPSDTGHAIQEENEKLIEEINKLLKYARLSNPHSNIELESVPLLDALENSIDRFSIVGKEKSLHFCLEADNSELFVHGNEDLLEDIFDNLISNAFRYAKSEIRITVNEKADLIRITVADDGKGLSEQDLAHMFERFYKGIDGNTGLGLSIVQKAAEYMGGKVTASNRDGGGAEFTVLLKRASF